MTSSARRVVTVGLGISYRDRLVPRSEPGCRKLEYALQQRNEGEQAFRREAVGSAAHLTMWCREFVRRSSC